MPNKENFIQKRYLQEENNYLKFTQGKENRKVFEILAIERYC